MNEFKKYNTLAWLGFAVTFIGAVLFSTKAIIVKLAFNHLPVDALTLLTLRMIFSLPFYLGVAWLVSKQKTTTALTRKEWLWVVVLGTFGYYLSSLLDFIGLQYISAGLERLILFLYPSFAVLINAFVFKQPILRMQKAALAFTYMGIGLAYWGEMRIDINNPNFFLGSTLIFFCAITYSIYIAGSGYIIPKIGATKFTAYAMLSATIGIFLHFLLAGNYSSLNQGPELWWYGLLLAIVATVIPSFLISFGLKRIGASNVAIISGIGPVATILQAHWLLGEDIFLEQVAGTALVIIGIFLIGWHTKSKKNS